MRKGDAEAHAGDEGGEGGVQSDAQRECFGRFEKQVRARAGGERRVGGGGGGVLHE